MPGTRVRALRKVVPIDFRARQIIAKQAHAGAYDQVTEESAAVFFREECKRLSGELVAALRENAALRSRVEPLEVRIHELELARLQGSSREC
jgi:hypothetical protein